jgi:hypothetical protein
VVFDSRKHVTQRESAATHFVRARSIGARRFRNVCNDFQRTQMRVVNPDLDGNCLAQRSNNISSSPPVHR